MQKIEIKCDKCQTPYLKSVYRVRENKKLNNKNYCSKECVRQSKIKSLDCVCKKCNKSISRLNKDIVKGNVFCSRNCAAAYNNLGVNRHGTIKSTELKCINCSTNIKSKNIKYCSNECQGAHKSKVVIENVFNGMLPGCDIYGNVSSAIRKYLHKIHNGKCCECGWSKINSHTGKIPLEVHHVDGNYKNNSEVNLQLLCPNCHSLTSNYRSRNKADNIRPKGDRGRADIN